jgi:nucleotide-binding universal stress UspA family protein
MSNKIVVGLDSSPSGKAALIWAAEQARSLGTTLRAVHALDWPYGLSSTGFPAPLNFMVIGAGKSIAVRSLVFGFLWSFCYTLGPTETRPSAARRG